jgi:hypothetical protein
MPIITVDNASFENQALGDGSFTFGTGSSAITGWQVSGGSGGVYDPTSGDIGGVTGDNIAYLYDAGATMTQTLSGYSYNANEQIDLTLDIGDPGSSSASDYRIEIVVGGVVVGFVDGNTGDLDTLQTVTVSSTLLDPSLNGQPVEIRIIKTGQDNEELHIDNVRASYSVLGPDGIVDGTNGDDTIGVGYVDAAGDAVTNGADIISSGAGNDIVNAGDGNDIIDGGAGNDSMSGGDGNDVFVATEGTDTISGGAGTNTYNATGDAQSGYSPDLQDEAIVVNVGTQGVDGSNDPGTYGDGSISLLNSGGSASFEDIQVFIAGEGQDSGVVGGGVNLLSGSPTIPADDGNTDYNTVNVDGGEDDAKKITSSSDKADGIEEVFFAQDAGSFSNYKFRFSGNNGDDDGGDGEQDILFFDLETFNDTFALEIASENGTDFATQDQVVFTNATSRVDNNDGTVTVTYIGSNGNPHTVTVNPDNAEVLVYGDQTPIEANDVINLSEAVRPVEVVGIDNNATGTFTPADGGPDITFGPSGLTFSDILTGTNPVGSYNITGGDESGTIGGIEFQNFEEVNFSVACFVRGTLIKTINGEVPIERLAVGDQVMTLDNGLQSIKWIGNTSCSRSFLNQNPNLNAIEIQKDALGHGFPQKTLRVSPQHRFLIRSKISERLFGQSEVLVSAKKLLPLQGVRVLSDEPEIEYWHMLFSQHEIVWSNGALTESLFTGREAMKGVSMEAAKEISMLFPEILEPKYTPKSARLIPEKGSQVKQLIERHIKNNKMIFDNALTRHSPSRMSSVPF